MKIILIISILLNVILIYNLGKYKQTIDKKQDFIDTWINKEKVFNLKADKIEAGTIKVEPMNNNIFNKNKEG